MMDDSKRKAKVTPLYSNYVSFVGSVLVIASLASIILLFLIEFTGRSENPYLGIVTYIILPTFLILGVLIMVVGMLRERRRRRLRPESEIPAYPKIDLNDPRQRRIAVSLLGGCVLFVFMSAFGSYRAYEYTESVEFCGQACHTVMKPEFVAFHATSHARIRCVDCHVGHGAESYARSKLSGARQLYALAFNTYSKPIETPVHNMRPANETCEQCHWPAKFCGAKLKPF